MGHSAPHWVYKSAIEVTKDWNGIDQIELRNSHGASARVSMLGGQVTSWRNQHGEELLFSSSKALCKSPKALRGGILICFPQFGNCGLLEKHGFARNRIWTIDENPPPLQCNDPSGKTFVDLLLKPSEEDLKCWPHSFEFRLRVCLATDGNLILISRVRNIDSKPFSFSFAYHTYLSVSDISEVRIEGLETLDYLDNLWLKERFTEQGDAVTFETELDRVYLGSPNVIAVLDHEKKRTCVIKKEGLPDVAVWNPWDKKSKSMSDFGDEEKHALTLDRVYLGSPNVIAVLDHEKKRTCVIKKEGLPDVAVWNPWDKKSKSMSDFGDEEYKQMLCVDGAAIERPVTIKPGEEWTGRLELSVVASSFCSELYDLQSAGF